MDHFKTRRQILTAIIENYDNAGTASTTGYPRLDEAMAGGLYPSKTYILAARKKVGKTMFMGSISRHLNENAVPHLWLALEMNGIELEQRQLSRDFKINPIAFLKHRETGLKDRIAAMASNGIADHVIYCDYPGIPISKLTTVIADAVEKFSIRGVIIDFMQLIGGGGTDNMSIHHDAVAYTVANLAKTLNIWILAAAQLNQDHNFRGGEGALMAADQVYHLAKTDSGSGLWIQLTESRYTPYMDIGSSESPGYHINDRGPYLEEVKI